MLLLHCVRNNVIMNSKKAKMTQFDGRKKKEMQKHEIKEDGCSSICCDHDSLFSVFEVFVIG